ncbi:MAG: 30S ribosomal protein S8 [Flavobacteriales bacterium]|jgi:small subunit ribosomal protein S8|nr:30S ribosomal protein S8 [Flavobacteriales bacterium]|tara:strand:+ start:252 stop:650 length:399 start_codon:yes stop_codon:yes gene_type:complete
MITDPIADFLTRIRNAQMAGHKVVDIPSSNLKKKITEILFDQGYIANYRFDDNTNYQGVIKIALKYDKFKIPAIKKLTRVSKPGLRKYVNNESVPRVINGLGIAILSTSKGVITDKKARELKIGGEVLCHVY